MRARIALWAVLAVFVGSALAVVLAGRGGGSSSSPRRLPALAASAGSSDTAEGRPASAALAPAFAIDYRLAAPLPKLPDHARAWTLRRNASTADVERLARALAVDERVVPTADGWQAGTGDRTLRIERAPGLPWWLGGNVAHAGFACAGAVIAVPAPARAPASSPAGEPRAPVAGPPPGPPCTQPPRPAGLPTRDEAERVARVLWTRLGVANDGVDAHIDDEYDAWRVSIDPPVGDVAVVGWSWSVEVGPQSAIQSASGFLAVPQRGDVYPLIGTDAAFLRLKQSPYGPGPVPLGAMGVAERAIAMPVCPPPTAGVSCPAPAPIVRTVTGVRLGLVFAPWTSGGGASLVPAYLFDIQDGGTVPVIAVEDRYLPKPTPTTTVERGAPGVAPASPTCQAASANVSATVCQTPAQS